jgi:hypothetical protein
MQKIPVYIFLSIVIITIVFAGYTDHRWEDWYITYKASKNLAIGNGLVYTIGQRVHSFTSPLGTLVPAFLCFITRDISDDLVIWLFRFFNAILLGLTGVMLYKLANDLQFNRVSKFFLVAMFSFNILIVDFSINGMETAFMMFFMTYYLSVLLVYRDKFIMHLSLAIAGLMYTRPDSIIYLSCIALGFFLFKPPINSFVSKRLKFIWTFLIAGAIAFLIYLPWLLWTWSYYGSPVPHTIVAKGLLVDYSLRKLFIALTIFPGECFYLPKESALTINSLFMPPYTLSDGWLKFHYVGKLITLIATFYFFWGQGKKEIRAISLAVFLMQFYLNRVAIYPNPWYLPIVSLPCILALAMIINSLDEYPLFSGKGALIKLFAGGLVLASIVIFVLGAYELRTQQNVIEFGNRKQIGLWLHDHAASSHDKVFMECLGYIGFYSGLKTYDFPGMSSPEIVASRLKLQSNSYARLIQDLRPDWVVLRPWEVESVRNELPELFKKDYATAKVFDVMSKIPQSPFLLGKGYMGYDARFTVFHLVSNKL